MNPRPKESKNQGKRTKALDRAARKLEEKAGPPDPTSGSAHDISVGEAIRQGWKEGA